MADVIFLLLIFFMVTSTLIIPSALDVNLPESTEQTLEKPSTEVYLDSLSQIYVVSDRTDSVPEACSQGCERRRAAGRPVAAERQRIVEVCGTICRQYSAVLVSGKGLGHSRAQRYQDGARHPSGIGGCADAK